MRMIILSDVLVVPRVLSGLCGGRGVPRWFLGGLALGAAALLLSFSSSGADTLELPLMWTADLKTFTESGPTVADIDGDGMAEVIVAGREEIIALKGNGEEMWRWRSKGRFMTYPAVYERAGRSSLLYAADYSGLFTCLDGAAGQPVWQAQLNGPSSWSASVVCDLEGDGAYEVVQTDEAGTVWAFNAVTGQALWQGKVNGKPASPAVGDMDGDGRAEIAVITGQGVLAALDAAGHALWEAEIGGASDTWATSAPVMFAASDGTVRLAAASNANQVFCFNAAGRVLWQRTTRGPVAASVSAGDLDLDGRADVFLITQLGVVYWFDEDGGRFWEIDMQGRSLAAGALIDLDDDGRIEYGLCTQDGHVLVLNDGGEFIFEYQFGNRTINVTPAFGDVLKKSPGLELVITGGESGRVFCFAAPAAAKESAQWSAYRGNEQKTGAWFGLAQKNTLQMVPDNLAWNTVFTNEPIRFRITNRAASDVPLKAVAECVGPDGARQAAATKVLGKRGELLLPLDSVVPGVYRFSWELIDAKDQSLVSGDRALTLIPFANDCALVERALTALRGTGDRFVNVLPLSAAALRDEARILEAGLSAARARQAAAPSDDAGGQHAAQDATSALVRRARHALASAKAVEYAAALGVETSLIVFEGVTWENRDVDQQVPICAQSPLRLTRTMVLGEHEPVALNLFNILNRNVQARILVESPEGAPRVTLHRSEQVSSALGEVSWDPLPELDESSVVTVPSLTNGEIWVDLDAQHADPGEHVVKLRIQALNGVGVLGGPPSPRAVAPPETLVEITIDVLPFAMVPPGTFRLCAWARLDPPAVADMLAHGNNVFIGPHGTPQYDGRGDMESVDYTALDAFLAPLQNHDVMVLLNGLPALRGALGSDEYGRNLAAYLKDLVIHLADRGVDTDHFALYPVDEPGGNGWNAVNTVVAFGKQVRAANPSVMVYVDGGGELPMFEAMAPYVDIWCPGISMLAEDSAEMKVMRTRGKMLWSYDCAYTYARPIGSNFKNINIIAQFRTAALFAFRHNATGIGYWSYNIGDDPWERIPLAYPLVYPGRTKPVASRRWEAVREGIEDYRILAALRELLKDGGLPDALEERIRRLIEVRLPEMMDQSFGEMKLGLARNVIDLSNNDSTMATFRNEMMACVKAVEEIVKNRLPSP